jgi:hypothetical protein
VTGDDAVAGDQLLIHAEVAAAMRHQLVDLFERARVEQQLDPLASGQLAGVVLFLLPRFAAAELGATLEVAQGVMRVGHRHGGGSMANGEWTKVDCRGAPSP